ncbi:hypothetical protein JQN72_14595 [Phycicoccus sp. CSK15P-2]|uniref:hypothetical protein n=1 Tax=Phycicoccus sp. CSK15P-2 TaxID=2807627 RepID=UPI001950222D|nr:hypothetical protein [Phycicoccus sp. CSK15P-2]MBM6405472.1 hypothetical protein [Phycicoccus sp. CSK15P-2]
MRATLAVLCLVLLPGAAYVVVFEGLRWFGEGDAPRLLRPVVRRAHRAVRRAAASVEGLLDGLERVGLVRRTPRPEPVPTVLLVLELRRLAAQVCAIEAAGQPHQAARLAAALAAYDHVLVELCGRADLRVPIGLLPLDPRHRLALETDLVASGVDW